MKIHPDLQPVLPYEKEKKRGFAPAFFIGLCLFFPLFLLGNGLFYCSSTVLTAAAAVSLFFLRRRESIRLRPRHFFGVLSGILFFSLAVLSSVLSASRSPALAWCGGVLSFLLCYLCSQFCGILLLSQFYCSHPPQGGCDCIIILGCALRGRELTPILKARTDRALSHYLQQIKRGENAPLLIPSGGQGPDESISEAAAIQTYLIQKGVPASHIRIEDRSRSTEENMRFSYRIAREIYPRPRCLFATTNYHLFRSMLWARRAGMSGLGVGTPTKWYYWLGAFLREYAGILAAAWPIHTAAALLLLLLIYL